MLKHYVIYSHGFGVRKDDRGLMTDIASAMPDAEQIMFDYNDFDETTNTMRVSPLSKQVERLREKIGGLSLREGDVVDLVAHSQGCLVAALAKPEAIRRMVFITPPDNVDTSRLIGFFGDREGSVIDIDGESRIPRRDGTTTIIQAAYWKSLEPLNPIRLYNHLPDLSKVTFVIANEDEVLGVSNFDQVDERIDLEQLEGNHDFNGEYRDALTKRVSELLS
jgi:pimeloyl-ACP methyl ester carboxylesterase